jgi:heptosyltransferase-1
MNTLEKRPNNVLIIRLSAIGDVVMASPLIGAFRRTYPDAKITWLVEEAAYGLLEGNPDLHEVIVWPRGTWRALARKGRFIRLAREIIRFVRRLRRKPKFDLALDAQGLLKSGIWAFLSGARERVGIGSREGSALLMTRVIDRSGASDRISSQYLLCAEDLGLDTSEFAMQVATGPEDRKFVESSLEEHQIATGYAVVCPFTTRPQKHWLEDRWAELTSRLRERYGLPVIILGGPSDSDSGDRILGLSGAGVFNLAGKTTVRQAACFIQHASLLIGVDTGLTHMGIAFDIPTVALFGATRPYLNTETDLAKVLYHPMECSPCRRDPTCEGDFTCMKAITVDEVIETASRVLNEKGAAP